MPPVWSYSALATGLVGCGVMLVLQPPGDTLPLWYLVIAVLGTGMSILGVRQAPRSRRRVWVAIAVGQMLYLLGDALWYLYESVLLKVHMDGRGFLARYGGEEFTVLIPRSTPAAAEPLLELLRTSVGDAQTCSIGAVEWRHDEAPSQATERADQALYEAKRAGRNRVAVRDGDGVHFLAPSSIVPVRHDITPVFQPIVDLQSGAVVGYEALSRFVDVTAAQAFASARQNGSTALLETEAIKSALTAHSHPGWLALNVSLSTLLAPHVETVLPQDLTGIVFEITEYECHQENFGADHQLAALRARGARFAIDDFGVGFSNLKQVLWLGPDIIKLDISIVRDVHQRPRHLAMIRALGVYACGAGARLCAEGVEAADERHALAEAGVAFAQGRLFGEPRPADASTTVNPITPLAS